jgi:hypothetical protein
MAGELDLIIDPLLVVAQARLLAGENVA